MTNTNNWIKAKDIGMEFKKLPDKVMYADINLQGERLVKYWEFGYICENLKEELGILRGDEYWLEKKDYLQICWLNRFNDNSFFIAIPMDVDNDYGSLRGVILARKIKTRKTILIGVSLIHFKQLSEKFIMYDTSYESYNTLFESSTMYVLPKTQLLLLTLFTENEQIPKVWTTLRRFTPQKHDYYNKLIGQEIKILIVENKEILQ